MPHIALVTNTGWSMIRHRGEQIKGLVGRGWRVSAIASYHGSEEQEARRLGVETYRLSCEGAGANIWENGLYFTRLAALFRRIDPDLVHAFGLKPSVWSGMAANLIGITKFTCTITGAGMLRSPAYSKLIKTTARTLWRPALSGRRTRVIFQNTEDLEYFVAEGLIDRARCHYIPGCGVDVTALDPNFNRGNVKRFVVVSRMMWSKGLKPFVEAARDVKQKHPDAEFLLVGGCKDDYDSKNPDYVPAEWLNNLRAEGNVVWLGRVPPVEAEQILRHATATVLLSTYGEGVPRSLIEAAALGTPIITNDAPGCRDVVEDGKSGFLCNGNGSADVAAAMIRLIEEPLLVTSMGRAGRVIAQKFDKERVIDETLRVYGKVYQRC